MTLLIDDYVIILLAEEVHGSLGVSMLSVGWATKYIIIWWSFMTVPVILTMHHRPQCEIEGTKETTIRTGCNMQLHPNVTYDTGAYGYIS
jgi:hypothetical protein